MTNNFIASIINNCTKVKVITINGFQMVGVILSETNSYITIQCGNSTKLVYKHAISTIEFAEKA